MRMGPYLLSPFLLVAALVTATLLDTFWASYLAAGLGLLAGLSFDRLGRIYRSDDASLDNIGHARVAGLGA